MSKVELSGIKVSFGPHTVMDGLDITILEGKFFTLLGPSGCGKTTLLRVVAGFIYPDKGIVRFGDDEVTAIPPHRRNTGMVFQDYALFPDKTVFDNIAYGLRARKTPEDTIKKKVNDYLEMVGLIEFGQRYPSKLSGGQRQRVALARALVISPKVLLMDEPLSALDAKLRHEMQTLIRSIQQDVGVTTIYVTHDQREALAMSDQLALMKEGKIEQLGPPEIIFRRPSTTYAAEFIGRANLLPIKIIQVNGDTAVCEILGVRLEVIANGYTKDDPVKLCVHHQEIQLNLAESGGGDMLQGKVSSVTFHGRHSIYEVELVSGDQVRVERSNGFGAPILSEGEAVSVLISNVACLVRA